MEIYRIEEYRRSRKLVYLDEGAPAFCLYAKEIKSFGLEEGKELPDETYEEILEVLRKRAAERCLYLLTDMARTEGQLRKKLKEGYYPDEAVEYALEYCRRKHYTDDTDYVERYADSKRSSMSKAMMRLKLRDRGVDDADIDRGLEQAGIDDREALESVIPKKMGKVSGDDPDMKGRQKVVRSLMSAGFRYDDIKDVMGRLLT